MAQNKKPKPLDINAVIEKAVNAGLQAGRVQAASETKNAYKDTEKRLYAFPVLQNRIVDNRERLQEYLLHGAPGRSKDIVRFTRTGTRLTPEEILDALVQDMEARIAADEYEVATIAGALKTIEADPYYAAVAGKFLEGRTDDDIAAVIPCDASTVRRNRGRLVRRLAVWLYGAAAL
ncbi:MAG: hypothetical protein LBD02_00925 [Christensenellaceae bacterium]|jgi:hypothetical protein|nr:hypothetical protein [Christensenellaceae bacterium]